MNIVCQLRIRLLLNNSLSWLASNLTEVVGFSRSGTPDQGSKLKALAEVALLCSIARRFRKPNRNAAVARLRDEIAELLPIPLEGVEPFLTQLRLSLVLDACGLYNDGYRDRLAAAFAWEFSESEKWYTWNLAELRYYLDLFEVPHHIPQPADLYYYTLLHQQPDISTVTLDEAYELTHTIFAMSDFGRLSLVGIFKDRFAQNCDYVRMLLRQFIQEEEWDLVAELLACCACLRYTSEPIFALGWKSLERSQLPSGCISLRRVSRNDTSRWGESDVKIDYHATIVTSIAAILTLELT